MIKNLLSNAFKFTQQGKVSLTVKPVPRGWNPDNEDLNRAPRRCSTFSVSDTGIGIPPDKQQIIFEAFQQADGSTSRKFGGTGLGLAISREIARLLGGEIRLVSSPGTGSTFSLYPATELRALQKQPRRPAAVAPAKTESSRPASMPGRTRAGDSRNHPSLSTRWATTADCLEPGDPLLLIVENDLAFAKLLLEAAREQGLQGAGHLARRGRAGDDERVQARRDHPGHLPARYRRLARHRPAQKRHDDPAHPGLHHVDRRRARPRA